MLPETAIRRLAALGKISRQGKRINGLFRLIENPIVWYEAYANIYSNSGAMTPGADGNTLDGFSETRVTSIIKRLKDGSYRFNPVRRTYVPKPNGKKRPLGISSGDDKLVQEVVRNILERIYEPIFERSSHGFRPGRSPHTALEQIKEEWTAVKWIIDMDLRSYFDTIPHDLLVGLLNKKIEDKRFIRLIQAMLDAGYLEDWTYHATYSGVPQGSIVSPVLANIYLHELDVFMRTRKQQFDRGRRRKPNKPYNRSTQRISRLRKWGDVLKEKEGGKEEFQHIQRQIKALQQERRRLPSGDPFDSEYKRLYYCRYADDYVIGIIGSRSDAEQMRQEVRRYIQEDLKLTIAEEKSHIRRSREGVTFVGYEINTYSGDRIVKVKNGPRHTTRKSVSEQLQLHIPKGRLQKFCTNQKYGNYVTTKTRHKTERSILSDAEIILAYNGEFRGLANYYALALNAKRDMNKLEYIWRGSLFKTLAHKHKTSVSKIAKQLKTEDGHKLIVYGKHKTHVMRVFRLRDLKTPLPTDQGIDTPPNILYLTLSRSELIRRLNAKVCEYCETRVGPFEVHHIRKMKDIKKGNATWQKMMAARNRKTLILCVGCHQRLHSGTLPDKGYFKNKVKGEPCAGKPASTGSVRGVRAIQ
jgi:group II intron reverse transcriptase/maturase